MSGIVQRETHAEGVNSGAHTVHGQMSLCRRLAAASLEETEFAPAL